MKTLFICKKRLSYGNSYGLLNSASFVVDYLRTIEIDAELVSVQDANSIDKVVTEFDPEIVIIEALWVTPEKLKEIVSLKRHKNRWFIIRLHSKITFIANEGIAFKWLLGYRNLRLKNLIIAPNNQEFASDLNYIYRLQTAYLPNIYNPPTYEAKNKINGSKNTIRIGCFGSIRPMKNHLAQAVAAIKFAKDYNYKLEFHINATRMEQQGVAVLANIRNLFAGQNFLYQLVEHDWLSHEDFINLVKNMDIGMQISLTETFNIVAADFVYNKIPLIVSNQIEWMPTKFQVIDTNSTDEMVTKLKYSISFLGGLSQNSCYKALVRYNKTSQQIWRDFMFY